jgi:hypothetical protein
MCSWCRPGSAVAALPLGQLGLELVSTNPETRRVLLQRKGAMPLLHQAVERHGYGVDQQPVACQEPAAWIKRAQDRLIIFRQYKKTLNIETARPSNYNSRFLTSMIN